MWRVPECEECREVGREEEGVDGHTTLILWLEEHVELAYAVRHVKREEGVSRLEVDVLAQARQSRDGLLNESLEGWLAQPPAAVLEHGEVDAGGE